MTRQTKDLSSGPTGAPGSTGQPGMTEIAGGFAGIIGLGVATARYYAPMTGTSLTAVVSLTGAGTSDTVVTILKNGAAVGTVTLGSGVSKNSGIIGTAFTQDTDYFTAQVTTLGTGAPAGLTVQLRLTGAVSGAALTSISTLTDVDLTGLVDGDLLAWNALQGKFVRATYNPSTTPALGRDAVPASPSAFDYEFEANTAALPAGWSWVNQGGATYQEMYGAGLLTGTQQAGDNIRMIVRAIPTAASFTAVVKGFVSPWAANYTMCAPLLLRNSTTGKQYSFGVNAVREVCVYYWSNLTSATFIAALVPIGSIPYWRIRKNSATSWDFAFSQDGISWKTVLAASDITVNLGGAPDQIGFMSNTNGMIENSVALHWFRVT